MNPRIPKYFLIRAILEERLERDYSPGDRLPSEAALCHEFKVSRITIQKALSLLEKDEVITREQGRGTFYRGPRAKRTETKPSQLLESLVRQQSGGSMRVLAAGTIQAPLGVAQRLGLPPGSPVVSIDRVGIIEGEPIIFIKAYLPNEIGLNVLRDQSALARTSLGSLLHDKHGIVVDSVRQTIGAALADPVFAGYLGVEVGAPVLEGERIYFDSEGRPVIFSHAFYRADRYRFIVTLKDWR